MLPTPDPGVLQQQDVTSATTSNSPFTMQSLRKLKDRKRALAQQTTITVSTSVDVKLKTQALDIANLKKERDDIKKELLEINKAREEEHNDLALRLVQVEGLSTRVDSLTNKTETLNIVNAAAKPLATRLEALELSAAELPSLRQELQDLKTVPERLAAVESKRTTHQAGPESNGSDTLGKSQLKPLSDRLDGLRTTSSQQANLITELKMATALQKTEVESLKTWKNAQPTPLSEHTVRELITAETRATAKNLNDKIKDVNTRLSERITNHQDSILALQAFKETVESKNFSDQLNALSDKIKEVEGNGDKTYAKANRLQKRIEDIEDELHPDSIDSLKEVVEKVEKLRSRVDKYRDALGDDREEVKNVRESLKDLREESRGLKEKTKSTQKDLSSLQGDFDELEKDIVEYIGPIKGDYDKTNFTLSQRIANLQGTVTQAELGRLPTRLNELEKTARLTEKLPGRIDELEKAARGPHFKKVGTTVAPSSPAPITPPVTNADTEVSNLKKSLQELRKVVEGTGGLTTQAQTIFERLNNMEATLASARPLDSVEQSVETMETTMDKTSVKTLEKAAEKKAKALITSERKAIDRNVEEVNTRLSKEILDLRKLTETRMQAMQALRNRSREPDFAASSADARTAPSEMSDLNTITEDIETLFKELETANATISAVQDVAPTLFNEQFDPLKRKVEEQLSTVTATMETHARNLSALMEQVSKSPTQQNGFGQAQQAQLNTMSTEVASLKTGLETLRSSLSTKADSASVDRELDSFTSAIRNMESRYENISTDTLYQGMVRWFTHMYPSLPQLQDDINRVQNWIAGRANLLDRLDQDATQLHSLVNIAPHLHEIANMSPQLKQVVTDAAQLQSAIQAHGEMSSALAKIDQASSDASLAISKAEEAILAASKAEQASSDARTANDKAEEAMRAASKADQASSDAKAASDKAEQASSDARAASDKAEKAMRAASKAEQASSDSKAASDKAEQARSDAKSTSEKAEQARSNAKSVSDKADQTEQQLNEQIKTIENIKGSVFGLQNSLRNLNAATSPFAKTEALGALQATVNTLQTQIGQEKQERLTSTGELRTTIDAERTTRVDEQAKIRKSIQDLRQAIDVDKIKRSILDLRRALDGDRATFAKADVVAALEGTLRAFQSEISDTQTANSEAIQNLRSAFDTDCSKRDTTEGNLQKSINNLALAPAQTSTSDTTTFDNFKRVMVGKFASEEKARTEFEENMKSSLGMVEGKVTALRQDTKETNNEVKRVSSDHEAAKQGIYQQLADINTAAAELREAYDNTVKTYIEPNAEFFGLIGTAFVVLSQLQQVVESLNQNLPVAPLKLEWDYYLPSHGQPSTNGEPSNSKGKGKSKQ
ncbi:hypothetical protein J4E93_003985 [Alternaria ventricosa]|uniref:uncharacterized protein n=1 Tax=Alternaria ventricosa TaxID=1187951 RepID=UPI0020C435E1|nr:uncharacterized protein J4E93_003985 [Alternaria ventricosa]KAI4649665.1 hypothetical protein J4E93_003985 [Alternaria ventricosa]